MGWSVVPPIGAAPVKPMVVVAGVGCMTPPTDAAPIGRIAGPVVPVLAIAAIGTLLVWLDAVDDADDDVELRLSRFTRPPHGSFLAGAGFCALAGAAVVAAGAALVKPNADDEDDDVVDIGVEDWKDENAMVLLLVVVVVAVAAGAMSKKDIGSLLGAGAGADCCGAAKKDVLGCACAMGCAGAGAAKNDVCWGCC